MSPRTLAAGWLGLFILGGAYACGSGDGDTGGTGASTGSGTSTSGTASGGADAGDDGLFQDHGPIASLAIDPPTATIDVVNGTAAPVTFQAIATYSDQFTEGVTATWTFDRLDLGSVTAGAGVFTASGQLGGQGTLTATVGSLSATAVVKVALHVSDNPAGLSPAEQAGFDTPDAEPSGALVYPYDKTVFARGILAPELMWNGGAAGDVYRIRLTEDLFEATIYTSADPPSGFLMSDDVWTKLTSTNAGEDVKVDIRRMTGGQAHAPMAETWTIAQGSLRGTIYYWAVNTGQLMKIAPGAASPDVVFDSGPADQLGSPAPANYDGFQPPWSIGVNGKRCVACHTVAKDGSRIAGVFERKGTAPSPWGTIDLTANPPGVIQMSAYDAQTLYLALTPDGKLAVHNDVDLSMHLADSGSGAAIPSALDAIADKVADPAFSPDGKLLAFSSNVTGSYPVEFWRADLDVFDFDQATQSFTNRRQIVAAGNETIAFPSFSPDSKWVVYQRGDFSRAKYGNNQVGHDNLRIADVAQQVGELPLDAASGVGLVDAKNLQLSYQPTVNPIAVGGYMWVVFVSPRDYGNKMVSAADPTYENRKQLWVAAVDVNPQPGKDPSHPAFWLRGQDFATTNMSGYWALEPCKQEGLSCDQGFECCTGFCQPDNNGGYACVPPSGGCSQIGEKCETSADCCGDPEITCIGGFCAQGQPN